MKVVHKISIKGVSAPLGILNDIIGRLLALSWFAPEGLLTKPVTVKNSQVFTLDIYQGGIRNKDVDKTAKQGFKQQWPQIQQMFPKLPAPFTGRIEVSHNHRGVSSIAFSF